MAEVPILGGGTPPLPQLAALRRATDLETAEAIIKVLVIAAGGVVDIPPELVRDARRLTVMTTTPMPDGTIRLAVATPGGQPLPEPETLDDSDD